jgi:hypothetical protein
VKWWKARARTPVEFDKAHKAWRDAKKGGSLLLARTERRFNDSRKEIETTIERTELGNAYDRMRAFGLDALPYIVEKIKEGDHDLLPLLDELTGARGAIVSRPSDELARRVETTLFLWEQNKRYIALPPVSAAKLNDSKP